MWYDEMDCFCRGLKFSSVSRPAWKLGFSYWRIEAFFYSLPSARFQARVKSRASCSTLYNFPNLSNIPVHPSMVWLGMTCLSYGALQAPNTYLETVLGCDTFWGAGFQPWHSRGKRTMAAAMVRNDADLPFLLWKHIWKLSVWCRSHRRSQNQISRGCPKTAKPSGTHRTHMTLLSWLPSGHLGVSTPRHIFWDGSSARSDVSWCSFPRAQRRQLRAWFQWTQSTRSTRHHKEDTWSLPDPKISKVSWEEWWVSSAFPHSAKSVAWPWRSMEHQLLIIFRYRV